MSREVEIRPWNLFFVRHGESEANIVQVADKTGDQSGYTDEFRTKSNSQFKLTPLGIEQAKAAGDWLRKNYGGGYGFNEYYVSSFFRARQTAAYLDLPEAKTKPVWKMRDYLREQSWGHLDGMPESERWEKYPDIMARKEIDPYYWPGYGGEPMANLVDRTKVGIIATLYRECANGAGIVVSPGNTMWAVRIVMQGLTPEQYREIDNRKNPKEKMNNCQILQYTRQNPENPLHREPNFAWMRTVCPWDMTLSKNEWVEIKRPKYTSAQLLDI